MEFLERIYRIEKHFAEATGINLPGTALSREQLAVGTGWCFGVGAIGLPKHFFHGDTPEAAVGKAEIYYGLEEGDVEASRPDLTMGEVFMAFAADGESTKKRSRRAKHVVANPACGEA